MAMVREGLQDAGNDADARMDREVMRCLDSVHQLLCLRDSLSQVLRQGWMEMASARYAMGPARVSQPLFSLKPHAASAVLSPTVTTSPEVGDDGEGSSAGSNGPVHFYLSKQGGEEEGEAVVLSLKEPSKLLSLVRRRAVSFRSDKCKEIDLAEAKVKGGDSDSVSNSESMTSSQAGKVSAKPLYWFGALVSPHLRAAQASFQSALGILVDIANAQSEAVHAHAEVIQLRGGGVEGPQTPDATDL